MTHEFEAKVAEIFKFGVKTISFYQQVSGGKPLTQRLFNNRLN